jgi:Fic family protein
MAFWMQLGEIQSKCEHIAGVPLDTSTADVLHQLYLAKGVLATTAIEGNTLTEREVQDRIRGQLQLPLSREYLGREIDNIVAECNRIANDLWTGGSGQLEVSEIKAFNRAVLKDLPQAERLTPGDIRGYSVEVGAYRGAPAEDCEFLLEKLCLWINDERERAQALGANQIAYAVLRAILTHLYLVWIHPFEDGNGRTARLMEFRILVDAGVPSPAAHLLSNHYNQTRTLYYERLARAGKSGGDVIPFLEYAVQGFLDGLKEQLEVIGNYQCNTIWRDYVYRKFRDARVRSSSDVRARQRELVLSLSEKAAPIPVSELHLLSPRITEQYARKTKKTVTRDLHRLVEMELVELTNAGARARTETILAFLPSRKQS